MSGDELKALRTKHALTQPALAELVGVHWNTVARWEQGARSIPEPIARLVVIVLKASKKGKR